MANLNITLGFCLATLLFIPLLACFPAADALKLHRRKIPTLTVYDYLINKGANSTQDFNSVQCAGPAPRQPNLFGAIFCFDMPLLKKKDVNSELLGRVQGTFTVAQQTGGAIFVTESFILTNATSLRFRGTFSAPLGIENIGQRSSKPITGGTDDFELLLLPSPSMRLAMPSSGSSTSLCSTTSQQSLLDRTLSSFAVFIPSLQR